MGILVQKPAEVNRPPSYFDPEAEVDTVLDDGLPQGPLLSDAMLADLRKALPSMRWPRKRLTELAINLAECERRVHVASTHMMICDTEGGDRAADEAHAKAVLARSEAFGALDEEREYIGGVFLAGFSHALQYRPHETADLLAAAFRHPSVRMAIAPVLVDLFGPTCDWLTGEQRDVRDRVADLELAAVEGGVLS